MNIVIPMAGLGTRFANEGFELPKPLIETHGKTLIEHSVSSLGISGKYIFITRKYNNPEHNKLLTKRLKEISPDCIEIQLDKPTRGSVETVLAAEKYINNSFPLIITNSDQITDWSANDFLEFTSNPNLDGVIVTYPSTNPKNSFAVVEDNYVTQLVEKNPVSDIALIGVHYWKEGQSFVKSAKKLLDSFEKEGRPECYISETYNYLIEWGMKIKHYPISANEYISLGTPYDLKIYEGKVKEFHTEKPKTIFCDIDGTLTHHVHRFSDLLDTEPILLPGVREKFNQWDSQGHKIILCTARKESAREMTERQLKSLGLCWDQLIMGVTSGERVLINDKLNINHPNRANSINVITNDGFEKISWDIYGL
jgi:dTDP-glucose pyrophosphorylase